MNQPLIESGPKEAKTIAEAFRAMADKVEKNGSESFGGAVVVYPPGGSDPVQYLVLDAQQDPAMFWGNLKTKCDIALVSIEQQSRNQTAFGRR